MNIYLIYYIFGISVKLDCCFLRLYTWTSEFMWLSLLPDLNEEIDCCIGEGAEHVKGGEFGFSVVHLNWVETESTICNKFTCNLFWNLKRNQKQEHWWPKFYYKSLTQWLQKFSPSIEILELLLKMNHFRIKFDQFAWNWRWTLQRGPLAPNWRFLNRAFFEKCNFLIMRNMTQIFI